MHWLRTRRLSIFSGFLFIVIFAAPTCLILAYVTNPYFPKLSTQETVNWESQIGTREFFLPNYLHAGPDNVVEVWCNVSSPNLVVGNYAAIVVQVTVESSIYEILFIDVTPLNALKCLPIAYDDFPLVDPPLSSTISMAFPKEETSFYQTYADGDWVRFQAAGSVSLDITIELLPKDRGIYSIDTLYQSYEEYFPDNRYKTNLVMAPVIKSEQTIQEQLNENLSQSLSYFVLFLALVEIAVALYDHTEDKEKKKEYDRIKAFKKRLNEAEN